MINQIPQNPFELKIDHRDLLFFELLDHLFAYFIIEYSNSFSLSNNTNKYEFHHILDVYFGNHTIF